jgi:hypothetical protein
MLNFSQIDRAISISKPVKLIVLILLTALAFLIAAKEGPLEAIHWDVPIYLYQAKRFAETHYLINYIHHASEIVAQVHGQLPVDEWYSEAYWRFVRLGHIAVLGSVVNLFGSTFSAVVFATWFYTVLLVAGIAFCFSSVLILGRATEPKSPWFAGAAISALLFILSNIYGYLAGNLVSEVLSIFLLGAAVLTILHSIKTGRLSFAILSGLLAFFSYTARIESVWTWLTFLLAYAFTSDKRINKAILWKSLLITGLSAITMYVTYAVAFYPLADPRHYLEFVLSLTTKYNDGVPGYKLIFVAGGLLWIGGIICLRWLRQSEMVRLGWLWVMLSALPWLPQIMLGGPSQTRMFALLIPPLFFISSAGWALLLKQGDRRSIKFAVVCTLSIELVSQPAVYSWLHTIPGIWRVQLVHSVLDIPNYEKIDYLPEEMATLSHAIYSTDYPTVLISNSQVSQEHLNLIRFFGPSYPADADLALVGDPTNNKSCDNKLPVLNESVLFCQGYSDPAVMTTDRADYRILFLRPNKVFIKPGKILLEETPTFALDEIRD